MGAEARGTSRAAHSPASSAAASWPRASPGSCPGARLRPSTRSNTDSTTRDPRRRGQAWPARAGTRRRPGNRRDSEGYGGARRTARRRSGRTALHHRADLPRRAGKAERVRRLLADPVLTNAKSRVRSVDYNYDMYDALTGCYTSPVRSAERPESAFRPFASSSGCLGLLTRRSTEFASTVHAVTITSVWSRMASWTGNRSAWGRAGSSSTS